MTRQDNTLSAIPTVLEHDSSSYLDALLHLVVSSHHNREAELDGTNENLENLREISRTFVCFCLSPLLAFSRLNTLTTIMNCFDCCSTIFFP